MPASQVLQDPGFEDYGDDNLGPWFLGYVSNYDYRDTTALRVIGGSEADDSLGVPVHAAHSGSFQAVLAGTLNPGMDDYMVTTLQQDISLCPNLTYSIGLWYAWNATTITLKPARLSLSTSIMDRRSGEGSFYSTTNYITNVTSEWTYLKVATFSNTLPFGDPLVFVLSVGIIGTSAYSIWLDDFSLYLDPTGTPNTN